MKRFLKFFISFLLFLSFSAGPLFAADSSSKTNYDDIKFPGWAKDLRRTEIITFGSLPFVTLWTTLGYSLVTYGEFRNPLDKSTDSFTEDDQWAIIKISAASCLALGLTDFIISIISRNRKEARLKKLQESQPYTITPAKEIKPPKMGQEESDEEAIERLKKELEMEKIRQAGFIEGVESAIF
ncbi:MAG: hypothetical protein K5873_10485 [Treponema sp.]|nr:hypothetical protein [Treponema sp.]